MQAAAGQMNPINYSNGHKRLKDTDPVAYADLVTSMCDLRAAVCIFAGVPVEDIDRDGYNLSKPGARARMEASRQAKFSRLNA
jgi:hypothetical protein